MNSPRLFRRRLQSTPSGREEAGVEPKTSGMTLPTSAAVAMMTTVDELHKRRTNVAHIEHQRGGTGLEAEGSRWAEAHSQCTWRLCRKQPSYLEYVLSITLRNIKYFSVPAGVGAGLAPLASHDDSHWWTPP